MDKISTKDIGLKIKVILTIRDIQQKEFASSLGILPQTLSGYLNGTRNISILMAKKIAKELNITIDELLVIESKPQEKEESFFDNHKTERRKDYLEPLIHDIIELCKKLDRNQRKKLIDMSIACFDLQEN